MSGGDSPESPPDQVAQAVAPSVLVVEPCAGVRLADAPILLLVHFHKALRAELAELRRVTETASESGSCGRELVLELLQRFEFLKLAFKYHCASEDEVIFLALDAHIKNVVCTYSLEHKSMDDLFDPAFQCLTVLVEEEENISKPLQELVSCIGIIQTSICQHMLKEEEQIFPLLMQQFSSKEQASLVWQFLCSVPIMLLEVFLPWMISFLSPDERVDVIHCIKEIVPKEKLLQEVVIYWLGTDNRPSSGAENIVGKEAQCLEGSTNKKRILNLRSSKCSLGDNLNRKEAYCPKTNVTPNPVDGLHLWHDAIRKDLKEILEKLYQIRSSSNFSDLASVVVQLKFLADILVYYSNALDKFFYPVLSEFANGCSTPCNEQFPDENQIDGLQRLLHNNTQNGVPVSKFVEKLCWELETSVFVIGKHLAFQETKVIPVISKNCSHEMQQQILYMSLHEMPLGLLKCAITWFSAHLSEEESRLILLSIKQRDSLVNKSFASLLHKWFCIGYSGKTSVERFRKDLQEMFKSRCSFLSEQIDEATGSSSLHSNMRPCKGFNPGLMKPISANKGKNCVSYSSSSSHTAKKYDTSHSSGLDLHIFFPGTIKIICPLPRFPGEHSGGGSILSEPKPMDLIFFFHKALKKDLEYLVSGSARLANNVEFVMDFRRRFHLIRFLYQIHSDAEDEIAFPALQGKGVVQNISHSYTIDHKLEVEDFNNISLILDELAELHVSVSIVNFNTLDQRMLKHHQLCMKLHDMCRSMYKVLSDHIQREEIELWPLFRECFSIEEQQKIMGCMLGRMGAEILQEMIPWLMASLTPDEQQAMMSLWRKAAKNTKFDEWLREWWDDVSKDDIGDVVEEANNPNSWNVDPLEVVSSYLSKEVLNEQGGTHCDNGIKFQLKDSDGTIHACGHCIADDKAKLSKENQHDDEFSECTELFNESDKKRCNEVADAIDQVDKPGELLQVGQKFRHQEHLFTMSQEDLEAAIRRVSRDSSLDPQKKSYIIQNLLMSRWIVTQQKYHSKVLISKNEEEIIGQCPSYRGPPLKLTFGCKHYKRNCKLVAPCCNQLYTCRRCHDEVTDHSMDRKSITQMMCMKCLIIQPIGATCSTVSCNILSMARYYCRICKLFDDEREIYHCPYCNLCRVGKGLGIDYFHCMNCNACMSRSLSVHICREKCFEDNCPICHEYIFTSCSPIKALPCGHLMHSTCFQDYTCIHYTCPICSKSLGDMQVYFKMLDALLAEEKIPEEYSGQTQFILCNDCEKRGATPFHWLHHKCSYCGSYNTRLL